MSKMRKRVIDGIPTKVISRINPDELLEAMILAILEIDEGWHETVRAFIDSANSKLEAIGSAYRFEITSTCLDTHLTAEDIQISRVEDRAAVVQDEAAALRWFKNMTGETSGKLAFEVFETGIDINKISSE